MSGQGRRPGADATWRARAWPSTAVIVLIAWALTALMLLVTGWHAIVTRRFGDADDAMRLLQVRDWLAGQGWFDVAQHRLNRGDFPMHWSRLVDLPLAGVMVLLRPLLGVAVAERVAIVAVPLLTLLAVMALVAAIARCVGGARIAPAALLPVALSAPLLFQLAPLRIDHHGWQIALALLAVLMLVGPATARAGAVAGGALAALLTISLEGLPIAAAIAGVAAIGWAIRPMRGDFLRALAVTLAVGAAALHVATRGPGFWLPACDAVAPAWLAMLGVAAAGIVAAHGIARFGLAMRLAALAAVCAAAAVVLVASAPRCLAGPFATLPPLVYRIWYLSVLEGRPLWDQPPVAAAMTIALPLLGIVGSAWAWRRATGIRRRRWAILLAVVIAATLIALFVNRAAATANALAAPGVGALLAAALVRARAMPRAVPRVLATLAALALAAPGILAALAVRAIDPPRREAAATSHRASCATALDMRALRRLPRGIVFAPIDMTPELLVDTGQAAVAGGYHRGARAMAKVIRAFTADPATARATIAATGADYLVACPGMMEMESYRTVAPRGLWARLERGERFGWLRPVPVTGPVLAWRIIPPLPTPPPRP